jgi:hypothetical protein
MAERQPLTSEQRKEIAKRRREKAAAAALEPELAAIDENPVPETKIGGTKPPKRKTGPSIADLNPMEEILINREEANKQLQEVELMRRRMVARAEDIERRAMDRKLSAARYAAAKQELEAAAASSHPTARSSHPTSRTDPMASSRAVSEYSYPASQYSSESDMARVNRPAGRVSSPDAVPALNLFPHGSRFTKPSEDQRDRARATAAVERAKRKPSEEVKAKARQAAEARRMRELEQASLSRPSLEQGSLSRPSLEQGSLSRPSVASGSLAQPSIASDMAVKHNLQEASVSERRAEELARRAKLVREVERAQADVAATAERVSTRSRNEADDEFGATPLHPEVEACRKMWARPNDMDADSTSSEDEGPVPTRVPPSVLRRKMKQRKAKRVQREARKAEASAPTDDKRALREYVQTATERVSGGDASKALNTATAEVARARREAEQLAQQARALRQESSEEESSESEYSDGPGMDAALRKRQEDDLKKARREAQYADLETKRALAKARVQEEMERVKFIRRSIAEKNLQDTKAQEAEAAKKDAKQQKKAVETIKMIAKKRAQSPVKQRAPVKTVPTDAELLQGEVAAFFLREPPREQLRFLKFALEPEQKKDLPAVAVAFRHANKPEQVMHDRTFDNAVLVEHICLDLEHQHVAYLRPYCLLLGVLIGRKPNLRKALLMGIVKILNGRMKGREKETFAKTPTLIAQSMDACRELMMRLVWGKSQGQLRDSWNPDRLSAKAEVARAQKKDVKVAEPAPEASPDAATVKESASYWNKRKAAEGIEVDRGPLCRIKAKRAHVPTEAMEMRMRKGDTLVVKRDELDGEPGWIFALKGSDAGYIPRANLLIDGSPARGARGVSFTDGHT